MGRGAGVGLREGTSNKAQGVGKGPNVMNTCGSAKQAAKPLLLHSWCGASYKMGTLVERWKQATFHGQQGNRV